MIELFQPAQIQFPIPGARLVTFELEEDKPSPVLRGRYGPQKVKRARGRPAASEFARFVSLVMKTDGPFTSHDFAPEFPMKKASSYMSRMLARELIWDTTRTEPTGGKPLKLYEVVRP